MSYQMCANFINTPLNTIPLDKCFPYHLQSAEPFTSQYLSIFITYLYILFIFLFIYTNLLTNTLILFSILIKTIINTFFFLSLNLSLSNLSLLLQQFHPSNLLSNLSPFKHFLISNLLLLSQYSLAMSIILLFLDSLLYFLDFLYELTHSIILFLLSSLSFYKHKIDLIVDLKNTLENSQ
ncbi:hypothetical protein GLOIN_2v809218 [Rhizophagus irregularis DAOM 181602=DAOM 197198]|uniref:Transmembrane protein n=1 Tax=Rhizophagus irregularis (strain DAOM 181602 / DAOM 197198 / MUCL 43194) TaxID=747089 RepID=A0A2P4P3V8_RHIID|nr:hypothetical protein GLOIN_2v809218 [Rhizophagus irregularis DAOM 181602=DAOM 197198]POG60076.1 hypothetical protein GLOIN_2v809218 [Rhizophagus irregularis DAOM 181602=DAOM 197198]|eukprot:XP_025166942.1 hypothetical protein GLOIN_2v809218 [Rhizophagus irregularis DAOM 181602=DAOM 197198]